MAIMITDSALCEVWKLIDAEIRRSEAKHPNYPTDPLRRTAITVEEALEVIREMVTHAETLVKYGLQVARVGSDERPATLDDLRTELVHTAAMCVKQLRAMEAERVT